MVGQNVFKKKKKKKKKKTLIHAAKALLILNDTCLNYKFLRRCN